MLRSGGRLRSSLFLNGSLRQMLVDGDFIAFCCPTAAMCIGMEMK